MSILISLHNRLFSAIDAHLAPVLVPTLARLVFAMVLLVYFWASALTKTGAGILGVLLPSDGAFVQIFPRQIEAFGYDFSKFNLFHHLVAAAGTFAEYALPLLIVIGLLTRLAALGMIFFVLVQSATDVIGHGVAGEDLGAWFDRASGALILDQRALWVFVLVVLVLRGAGPLSADRLLRQWVSG